MAKKNTEKFERMFTDASTNMQGANDRAQRDRDYYDGYQWTEKERKILEQRKQPVVTFNRIKPKIDALIGMELENRTDPKALPRNPEDTEAAASVTKALRYVADNNDYDTKRSEAFEDLIVEGVGAIEWSIKATETDTVITGKQIPWDRYFFDPASRKLDFTDASYNGIVIWMDFDRAKAKWPKLKSNFSAIQSAYSEKYDDRPKNQWIDSTRKRVRIVKMYYLKGEVWHVVTFTRGLVIQDIKVPFVDDEGDTYNPLNAMSAFMNKDNERYGLVRQMISPQDEINKRRSKMLHLVNQRQLRISRTAEASNSQRTIRQEMSKPDGMVIADPTEIEILPTNDMSANQAALLTESKAEIDAIGVNPSLQGKVGSDLSGRALLAQQSAGALELGKVFDKKRHWDMINYRIMFFMIKQFWNEPKWVRVTDDEGKPEFLQINEPVTNQKALEEQIAAQPPEAQAALMEQMQLLPPELLEEVIGVRNNVATLDVDIIISEGQDIATLKSEQFNMLAQAGVLGALPLEVILELMPNVSPDTKERIENKMTQQENPEAQALQKAIAELQVRGQQADVEKTESETAKNLTQAEKNKADAVETLAGIGEADL